MARVSCAAVTALKRQTFVSFVADNRRIET